MGAANADLPQGPGRRAGAYGRTCPLVGAAHFDWAPRWPRFGAARGAVREQRGEVRVGRGRAELDAHSLSARDRRSAFAYAASCGARAPYRWRYINVAT